MLTKVRKSSRRKFQGLFGIVASEYNHRYVDAMLTGAVRELKRAGAKVDVVRVPGAFEIPVVATHMARTGPVTVSSGQASAPRGYAAIICLGVILRGATVHATHIGDSVSRALMQIQVECEVPVIHEVLLLENEQQAEVRCLDPKHNRGVEAARTALAMARVMNTRRGLD